MVLQLEAIKFNHDPFSASVDGFNIRKNEKELIVAPEWRRGISVNPEDSPAAYSLFDTRGNRLTIQASFSCEYRQVESVDIRAVDGHIYPSQDNAFIGSTLAVDLLRPLLFICETNLLGEVEARNVKLSKGSTGFKTFNLNNVRIWDAGVAVQDIVWRWQVRIPPFGCWTDFATTSHRIYTTLSRPREPWQQSPFKSSNIQLPWTAVLEYACRWAATTQNPTDAATLITRRVYQLGSDGIARYCGRAQYAPVGVNNFRCAQFLFDLKLGSMKLNCTDCATIVSTFANILGAELWQSETTNFEHNPVLLIGESEWQDGPFSYHVVAWEEDCDFHNDVFDACLQIDADEDPTSADKCHVPLLPTDLRFGKQDENLYRDRLVAPNNPPGAAEPRPCLRNRRPIEVPPLKEQSRVSPELLAFASESFELESFLNGGLADKRFFKCVTPDANFLKDWTRLRSERLETDKNSALCESLWRSSEGEAMLLINIYEGASIKAAREWFHNSIAALHSFKDVSKVNDTFADVFIRLGDKCGITFVIANLAISFVNVGKRPFSVEPIAQDLFQQLTVNIPESDTSSHAEKTAGEALLH